MKRTINQQLANYMILGSSFYATGGGYEYEFQKKLFQRLFKQKVSLTIVSMDELRNEDYLCTTYCVGSAANTHIDLSSALKIGIATLEKHTGKEFKAIFPGETNVDIVAFQAASQIGLPVLDADSTGGRAVPEIKHDNFIIKRKETTPVVAVTPQKEVIILTKAPNADSVEKIVRTISQKGLTVILDHVIKVKEAKNILTSGILTRSITLGAFIEKANDRKRLIDRVIEQIEGRELIRGIITNIEFKENNGFLEGFYTVKDTHHNSLKIYIKNENLICWLNEQLIVTPPDLLITIDTQILRGIHNSKLYVGQKVSVVGKAATRLWRSSRGQKLFHPRQFGFDIETKLA